MTVVRSCKVITIDSSGVLVSPNKLQESDGVGQGIKKKSLLLPKNGLSVKPKVGRINVVEIVGE